MLGNGRSAPTNSVPQSGQPPYPFDSGYFIAMDGGVPRGLAMALGKPSVITTTVSAHVSHSDTPSAAPKAEVEQRMASKHPQPYGPPAVQFPVIIAAPMSTRIYARDRNDTWVPTIEQTNSGTYDTLRLKRISFYLGTASIHGSPMGFGFDGSLIIPRDPEISSADDAVDAFNKVVASLLIGGIPVEQVSASDLAFGVLGSTGYYRYHEPHGPSGLLRQALGEGAAGGMLAIDLIDPPVFERHEIEKAFEQGEPVLSVLSNLRPEFLLMSFSYYRNAEYRNSLIYGWLIVEQLIDNAWNTLFLQGMELSMRQARESSLKQVARNVSGKIEFLMQTKCFERSMYLQIQKARQARNDLIHSGRTPSRNDVYFCLKSAAHLIAAICRAHAIPFEPSGLLKTIAKSRRRSVRNLGVTANPDWSKPKFWRPVKPIPGEVHFSGNYEQISDIYLAPVYRKDFPINE